MTEIRMAWQVPIHNQSGRAGGRFGSAHYFEVSEDTDRQVKTLCGQRATPGFAKFRIGLKASKCEACSNLLLKRRNAL